MHNILLAVYTVYQDCWPAPRVSTSIASRAVIISAILCHACLTTAADNNKQAAIDCSEENDDAHQLCCGGQKATEQCGASNTDTSGFWEYDFEKDAEFQRFCEEELPPLADAAQSHAADDATATRNAAAPRSTIPSCATGLSGTEITSTQLLTFIILSGTGPPYTLQQGSTGRIGCILAAVLANHT
eukprot:scaffold77258_cov18-Prasinocladus_malaysianus.AAC.1